MPSGREVSGITLNVKKVVLVNMLPLKNLFESPPGKEIGFSANNSLLIPEVKKVEGQG